MLYFMKYGIMSRITDGKEKDRMVYGRESKTLRKIIINVCILLMTSLGIENIVFSLPYQFKFTPFLENHYRFLHIEMIYLHKTLSTIIGFILLFLSYRLYKRMRIAWMLVIIIEPVSLLLKVIKYHDHFNTLILVELLVLCVLSIYHKEFNRRSDPINLKKGVLIAVSSIL